MNSKSFTPMLSRIFRKKRARRFSPFSRKSRWGLWATALLTGAMGLVNLISAVTPSLPDRVEWLDIFLPFSIQESGHIFSALAGFVLLTLATNLLRRKRMAWALTVGLLLISMLIHLIKGLDYEECILAVVLLGQLILMRRLYTARSDRPSIAQGLRVLLGALIFTLAYGTLGFYILDGYFQVNGQPTNFGWFKATWQTLAMFLTEDNAGLHPTVPFAQFFADSVYIIGTMTLVYACFMLLRPVLLRGDPATSLERRRARAIIDQHGQSSLARLALLRDKSYYFSPSGQSVIAYVTKGRAAIALGDPIGPAADRWETVVTFSTFCDRNDWYPVFYEAAPAQLGLYQQMGFHQVQIGEEAIVDLTTFTLKGKAHQNLRTAINRMGKSGHRFALVAPPIAEDLLHQLKPISDAWLKQKNGVEKRFSIGWFDYTYLQDCHLALVYNQDNQIVAFANLLSGYNRQEMTVDLMRYRPDGEKGMMDFLFVSILQELQHQGYDSFNFSLSPLAGVGETAAARKIEKGLHYFFKHLNQFYNFKGLHAYKEKFQPRWEPRYLVYPRLAMLPEIAMGLVRADSGDRLFDYFKPGS